MLAYLFYYEKGDGFVRYLRGYFSTPFNYAMKGGETSYHQQTLVFDFDVLF